MKTGKVLILLLLASLQGALTALGVSVLTQHYEYDENGRLVAVTVPENPLLNERYRYDGSGNLVEKQLGERIYRMSYDGAHQLKSQEGPEGYRAFYYDGAGRLARETLEGKTVVEYRYGYLDKVVEVIRDGERAEFFYDGQGMLAGKRVNGEYEAWTWDGLALVARGDERYVNEGHISGGVPVLSHSREGMRYHQTDILGTTLATYTADGKMEPILASAFGADMGAGSLTGTHRFTGKPYDRHLGAHVFPYRNYDATVARWRSSDPAGFPDGPNGHFYAPVPTMGLDPWGLASAELRWRAVNNTFGVAQHSAMRMTVTSSEYTQLPEKYQGYFNPSDDGSYSTTVSGYEQSKTGMPRDTFLELRYNHPSDTLDLTSKHGDIEYSGNMMDFILKYMDAAGQYKKNETKTDYDWFPNDPDEGNCNSLQSTLIAALNASINGNLPSGNYGWGHQMDLNFFGLEN